MRRVFRLRRAWQALLDSGDPGHVTRAVASISRKALPVGGSPRLFLVPRPIHPQLELCCRQYLLSITLYSHLQPGLLLGTQQAAAVASPAAWRAAARDHGFAIHELGSRFAFARLVLLHWLRGAKTGWRLLFRSWRGRLLPQPAGDYEVLCEMPGAMLPRPGNKPKDNLILWYHNNICEASDLWVQTATPASRQAALQLVSEPFPRLTGSAAHLQFVAKAAWLVGGSLAALCIGCWWPALLLRDLMQLAFARSLGAASLARAYTFENSRWIHRPLFTHWAEAEGGARAQLLFYSTNMDQTLRIGSPSAPTAYIAGYQIMSWTRYLVWDDYQAAAIVAFGQDRGRVQIVGAVPLTDTGAALPPLPPRVVGVFDVAPFKPARLAAMGLIPAFYTGAIAVAFLEDLHNALAARGYTMVLKQKRNIGNHADACYRRFLDRAAGDGTVLLIDPGVAAARLIRVCDAVVCMPFTSPALLAQGLGRPVAYYDPTASLPALSRQAHGLPMLAGPPALAEWLDTVLPTAIERSAQV